MKKKSKAKIGNTQNLLLQQYIKICAIFLFLCLCGNISAGVVEFKSSIVTLSLKNASFEVFCAQIEKQTGFVILYKKEIAAKRVSVTAKKESLEVVLNKALSPLNLKFHINGKQIIVSERNEVKAPIKQNRFNGVDIQTVKGKVIDQKGEPLMGAAVSVKGYDTGTMTDLDGLFSVKAPVDGTLSITYIGYNKQEVSIAGKENITVTMLESEETIDEVVIVGFGVQKKVNVTGSVGMIDSKAFEERPISNAVQALQGVIPGLNITTSGNGGELNATKTIDIRGTGTIGGDSKGSPLVLIDGMEGDLNSINPQDIESVSVLKDASASAIYGARAPFGVILVTTKSGHKGKMTINYNNSFRYNTPVMMPEMVNSWEYVNMFNDASYNNSGSYLFDASMVQNIRDYLDGKIDPAVAMNMNADGKWDDKTAFGNTNWLDEYYQKWSHSQEHNISISGGNDKVTYYLSGNYLGQNGFLRYGTDTHDRYTITGKFTAKVTDFLSIRYSNRFVRTDYDRPTIMSSSFYDDVLRRAKPFVPAKDPNGYYNSYIPMFEEGGRRREQGDRMAQQVQITLTPLKNWNIVAEMNANIYNSWQHEVGNQVNGHYANDPDKVYPSYLYTTNYGGHEYVYEYAYRNTYLNPTFYTNYTHSFKDRHNIGVILGFQYESNKNRDLDGKRKDLVSSDLPVLDLTTNTEDITVGSAYNEWATAGFFGRINYDYEGKYLLEVSGRYDGTSRFRRDNRWVFSPSFSLGWNIAQEHFFERANAFIDVLKPRFSYGSLANQNVTSLYPTYQTMATSTAGGHWLLPGTEGPVQPNIANAPSKMISTTLTWEKIETMNIGLDWSAFKNRFTGSFDYFIRKTLGMVGPGVELPATLGVAVPRTNNSELKASGWELEVSWRDRIRDFSYGIRLNISDARTKVVKYPNPTGLLSSYVEGTYLNNYYGYTTIGIAKTDEEMQAHLASLPNGGQSALFATWTAGDIMYKDINGDGKISSGNNTIYDMGDKKLIGNSTPRFRTGINIDMAWKGIDLSMFWQGVLKRDYFPEDKSSDGKGTDLVFWGITKGGKDWSTGFKQHLDYFRDDPDSPLGLNLDAYYPKPMFNNQNKAIQTRYMQNAAYLRLKNLQVGYTFPERLTKKIFVQKFRIYFSGENLLTFTKLSKTMDPETAGIGGRGGTVYPLSKTYSFGLSVNF